MIPHRKNYRFVHFIALLCLISNLYSVSATPQIYSISTSQSSIVSAEGSIQGGTYVYIKGNGFSSEATQNKVYIGPYTCNLLSGGSKQDGLSCQTTKAVDPNQRLALPVTVQVLGGSNITCAVNACKFYYKDNKTPSIQQISPRTSVGKQQIAIWGKHRITNLGDQRSNGEGQIKNFLIDDIVCSTLDIVQQDYEDPNMANNRNSIRCIVFKDMEAGQYGFTQHVDPGKAQLQLRTLQTSYFTQKNYTQRIAAQITNMPYHVGGVQGQQIEVKGTGFSKDPTKYSCSIGGQTCSVKNPQTTSATIVIPSLNPSNTDFGALPKDPSDSSTTKSYLGSNGFRYTRYTIEEFKYTLDWLNVVRSANTLNVQVNQIRTQLRSTQQIATPYLEYWRGYFYAPVDGQYRFAGLADDGFRVQLSSLKNNADVSNLQDLIYNDAWVSDIWNPYFAGVSTMYANKTLTQGYYYMEIVHFNWQGPGQFRIIVDMPKLFDKIINPTWQIDQFTIVSSATTPQIIEFKVTKTMLGTDTEFKITYKPTFDTYSTASIIKGATAAQFKEKITQLSYYGNWQPTVTLTTKDGSGAVTTNASLIESYIYRLTYTQYRDPPSSVNKQFDLSKSTATFMRIQNHSAPITGNYKIQIDGTDLKIIANNAFTNPLIPYNTGASAIQDALNNRYSDYNNDKIRVSLMKANDFDENIKMIIEYVGIFGDAFPLTIVTTGLLGGNSNTFTSTVTTKRYYSAERPLYSPLPFQFMRTAQTQPQLYLKVNSIPVVCSDCAYTFNSANNPAVTASSLTTDTLSLTITDPGSVGFVLSDLVITLNGARCNQITGSLSALTCKFNTNTANSAALPAGNKKPLVHIAQIGYAKTDAISSIPVSITITQITPAASGFNGGIVATLTGFGFPLDSNTPIDIYLLGNKVQKILTVSNQVITFEVPRNLPASVTNTSSTIAFNQVTQTITGFTYDNSSAPTISGLSTSSESPILKTSLTITGTKFSNLASTKVFLIDSQGNRKYQLTVSSVTSTSIQCILGGGKTGTYNVAVLDANNGLSELNANTIFNYEIIVDSISPVSGSLGGGYDLTITGRNFAIDPTSHTVFVGEAQNVICKIKSNTATQIVCTMPTIDTSYFPIIPTDPIAAVQVVVTGRILEESVCKGTCGFTYDPTNTTNITVPTQLKYNAGDIVTITGTGLSGATVKVGTAAVSLNSSTSTSLSFVYPALKYGLYEVKIFTANGAYTYPPIITNTTLSIAYGISRSSGSLNGHRISVAGNGFPTVVDSYLSINLICANYSSVLQVVQIVPNKITFETIPSSKEQVCGLNVTYETSHVTFQYTYRLDQTPRSTIVQGTGMTYIITITSTPPATPDTASFQYLSSQNTPTSSIYPATISKLSTPPNTYSITPTGGYLPNGKFRILVHTATAGYHAVTPATFTRAWSSNPTVTPIESSFVGGKQLTLTGAGFISSNIKNNQILVCGLKSSIVSASATQLVLSVPPFVTSVTQNSYKIAKNQTIVGTLISDSPSQKTTYVTDDKPSTYYTSLNPVCYIGFNFGSGARANIQYIKYMPNVEWPIAAAKLDGAKFEGSNDNSVWTPIFTVDTQQVHTGWNYWTKAVGSNIEYQYVRFSHTNTSKCQLSGLQISGIIYSTVVVDPSTDKQCDVVIKAPTDIVLTNAVTYSHSKTSTITVVNPLFGPSTGSTSLTITGTNFGTTVTVTIDGIDCPITSKTSTQIVCTTGVRATVPNQNSFVVVSDGNPVLVTCKDYMYIDRWSSQATWGGEALPREGDVVYVPKGQSLLVDVASTPVLDSILVQGRIIFSDQLDMTIDAHHFIISGGQFTAGTQTSRYQHQLTITLYGGYYNKQLPIFGNKVLGCRNCKFSLHGKQRTPTWTQLLATIAPGATQLQLLVPVDWVAGQKIVVASSSFDHYEAQQRTIASISANKTVITVTQAFKYKHFAAVQTYGSTQFPMRAEVGLLTRNIKIQGDKTSQDTEYGAHMMMNGKKASGLVASFSYVEITKCGQPKIVGRYCSHFHMTGQMPDSSVRGMAVHHSYARVLTIHGTHFLTVEKNVGYHVKGHNIFIEDGIQTNNVIQDNLMISSITSLTMLQSDTSVASYWITNPYNTVRRNHAAGSDFYGFWYQVKQHPDGPSATFDICPMGMQLGESKDNVAHSNVRFGLRIFKLSSRKFPCIPVQDQGLQDPYSVNQAIQSVFQNYTLWRNAQCGFLGQQLGFTTLKNFKVADSKKGGMQFHKTNFTKQLVVAKDSLIVGYSQGNAPADIDQTYNKARGVIASRTDGLFVSGITFYNFGPKMTPLQSCSQCWNLKLWVVGSKTTTFEKIAYNNVQGDYIFWQKWRRQVFVDVDGTLLRPAVNQLNTNQNANITTGLKGSITPYRPSVMIPGHCYELAGTSWNHSTYCDSTITLRSILFTNADPAVNFNAINIKARLLNDPYDNLTLINPLETEFSSQYMIVIKKMSMDIKHSWAMPFVVGKIYNIHWKWGIDFDHLSIAASRLWTDQQGLILRFNYTDNRELFYIGKWYKKSLQLPLLQEKKAVMDPTNCENGDYYHDNDARYFFVCVSGRNKTIRQWIDVTPVKCLNSCPKDIPDGQRQNFTRLWSVQKNWLDFNLTKPLAGENVTIPYEWNLILDQVVPAFKYVQINGVLIFDASRNHTFQAHYIWVKKGIMRIGYPDRPYLNQAQIILLGEKDDRYLVLDQDASGNKILAVTGELQFYGQITDNVWTRLTQIATVGSNTIKVAKAQDWKVGDRIVIAPTYSGPTQYQQVTITEIDGNTITIDSALKFQHYGASSPITNNYGVIDTRAGVGLLSRNIKIKKGPDANGWGCRVLVYGFQDPNVNSSIPSVIRNGKITFDGVQIDQCGQYDTDYAAIRFQALGKQKNNYLLPNIITRSSIHNSNGMGVWITNVTNLKFDNNVLNEAKKFIMYAQQVNNYTITNNLFIGARKRPQLAAILSQTVMADDVACYEQYNPIDFDNDNVTVTKNLAQGSQTGQGFVFPYTRCDALSTYNFGGNTAGSCQVAFMLNRLKGETCIGASKMVGYASEIGLMANPMTNQLTKIIYEDMIFVDNQRGITLRFAHQVDDAIMILRNSYFAGFSRPNCPSCYSSTTISYCQGGYAVRMLAVTQTGEQFPLQKKNIGFDVICTRENWDMKNFINNVTFQNYLYTNPSLPYCTKMKVFQRHNLASDITGSVYLTNSPCVNCQQSSWVYFDQPSTSWKGWFGGCGQLDCTGPNNYIIYDQDGKFTGNISQILSNNSQIGDKQNSCTYNPNINGHYCLTDSLAVMQYESIAPDFQSRIMWPVFLKYDTGAWESSTNGWKQWQWNGPEPLNKRLARFVSVVKLHQNYNMTYSSQPPSDTRFQIQKRILPNGNASDWVIIRIYYPLPNSIQVLIQNTTGSDIVVKPFAIKEGKGMDLRNYVDVCGANNFHYDNGTIEFVLNGKNSCIVRVRLTSYVKISARLSIPILDFYNNNGPTTFITNICAFLGIDTSRLKIVGIRSGSTILDVILQPAAPTSTSASGTTVDPSAVSASLAGQGTLIANALSGGHVEVGATILSVSTQVIVINTNGTIYIIPTPSPTTPTTQSPFTSSDSKLMIIILATVIPSIVILIVIAGYCYIKRKRERISAVNGESEVSLSQYEDKKHQYKRETIKVSQIPFEISKMTDVWQKY